MAKVKKTPKAIEKSKRGAAAVAHLTQGMSRVLSPNRRAYDRKKIKREIHE